MNESKNKSSTWGPAWAAESFPLCQIILSSGPASLYLQRAPPQPHFQHPSVLASISLRFHAGAPRRCQLLAVLGKRRAEPGARGCSSTEQIASDGSAESLKRDKN